MKKSVEMDVLWERNLHLLDVDGLVEWPQRSAAVVRMSSTTANWLPVANGRHRG